MSSASPALPRRSAARSCTSGVESTSTHTSARWGAKCDCNAREKKGLKCAQPVISMSFSILLCPQVTKEDEFFSLSHCQLLELISQDSLKVLCESEVCGVREHVVFFTPQHTPRNLHRCSKIRVYPDAYNKPSY